MKSYIITNNQTCPLIVGSRAMFPGNTIITEKEMTEIKDRAPWKKGLKAQVDCGNLKVTEISLDKESSEVGHEGDLHGTKQSADTIAQMNITDAVKAIKGNSKKDPGLLHGPTLKKIKSSDSRVKVQDAAAAQLKKLDEAVKA